MSCLPRHAWSTDEWPCRAGDSPEQVVGPSRTADGVARGGQKTIHRRRLRESIQLDTHLADWGAAPSTTVQVYFYVYPPGAPRHGAGLMAKTVGKRARVSARTHGVLQSFGRWEVHMTLASRRAV